jgi:mannose/fructose/N-acetylgalactosamine-specific phosphotransferase system component IID/mannose/fructose/N-acetylgalactosamine-specific phosphotransferase system component IIC
VSILGAIGFGLYYWLAYYDTVLIAWIGQPMVQGFVWGILFGNVPLGMQCGGMIQLVYIASVAVGANMPADRVLAAIVAIPIALTAGMTPEQSLALAVPFGILGTAMDNARRLINGLWNRKSYRDVEKLNYGALKFNAYFGPALVSLPIRAIPVAAIMYFGVGNADKILGWLPEWLTHGMAVVGGMLPAIGMLACTRMIGKRNLLPYFVIGYFVMKILPMGTLTFAIFALMVALLVILSMSSKDDKDQKSQAGDGVQAVQAGDGAGELQFRLTKKELRSACWRVLWGHRISQCMEYFYGTGTCLGLLPVLRKLYGHDDEQMKDALRRHLAPYISEMTWGHCILGVACAMEEQRANGAPITGESINAIKTGLMGPFAGLGDTLNYFIMSPIITAIFIGFAMQGSPVGLLSGPIVTTITQIIGYNTFMAGYRLGRDSLLDILRGGWIDKVMTGAGILGMMMMGALSASYVKLSSVVTFTISQKEFVVQSFFDQIVPGFLPFAILGLGYWFLNRKGGTYSKLMLIYLAIGLLGTVVGFF